ncbi:glycosyltransferase family 4 protein [Fictibacillus halophilus]|uniref:glycosyltransferase family 4 protein n=1 Tax=Fictibacillus halophilus TaxID=1610490 RepID=UPI001CFAE38C|nr:glycosyltransferase family 1 protein [Fictibacillus halophilus]
MRIGVNLLTLSKDRYGGVEHYVKHLIEHLKKADERVKLFLFLTKPSRDIFDDFQDRIKKVMLKGSKIQTEVHSRIQEHQIDVWFSPVHKSYIPNIQVPSVATIHDVLHTRYPQFVPGELQENNRYYEKFTPSFDAVLTVSAFSKNTISNQLQIPKEKITAIYPDAPEVFNHFKEKDQNNKIIEQLENGFALYPASYNPHKNHLTLLKAIVFLRDHHKTRIPLVLTGFAASDNRTFQSVLSFIQNHSLQDQVKILGYVPTEAMPDLYAKASFLVFPSLYEGFGIPLVEAMKSKCPIICSDRASIPEVAGDAALYFNPERPEDIANKMLKISHPETRNALISKGMVRSKNFSWDQCAKETLAVFQQVIKRNVKR